ncbi:hypothetical protein BC936DRAFT_138921 [Jimgerdemannia flammicorona]|uniref:VASt domain-containing protein n=1 Tax=Jimgerdemannia flammicorona TaxID=994334 RepID=A0A433BDX5_9FUNG|nr:hypothetical protein BC936DRAFT_138921 [Jimgerdemannia flammicorona]
MWWLFVDNFNLDILPHSCIHFEYSEVEIGTWAPNDNGNMVRLSSYIKYLNNSLGPRSTKCLLREECLHKDSDRYVSHLTTTQTPDVPSGGAFTIKTRTCIMWAGPAESRVVVSFTTEWTKSSWLKAAIDKGASDGQIVYYKLLDGAIRKHIAAHLDEFTNSTKSKTAGGAERKKPKRKRERNPAGGAKKFGNATLETGASSAPFSGKDAQERAERIARRASTRSIRAAHNAAYKIVEFFFTTLSTVTSNFFARLVELLAEAQVPSITQLTFIVVVAMFAANYYIFIKLTDVAVKIEDIRATVAAGNGRVSRWGAGSGQHRTGFADKEIDDMRDLREQEEILWQWLSERAQNAPSRDAPASDVDHATPTASPPAHDDTETPDDAEKPDAAAPFQPSFDSRAPDLHNLLSKEQLDGDVHELQFQVQAAEERLRRMIGLVENSRDRIWDQTTTSAGLAGNAENDRG